MKTELVDKIGNVIVPSNELEEHVLGSLLRRLVAEESNTEMSDLALTKISYEADGIFHVSTNDNSEYWALNQDIHPVRDTRED